MAALDMQTLPRDVAAQLSQGPSVGDVAAFDTLPDDVRALAIRVLGDFRPSGDVIEAYAAGFEDGVEEVATSSPRVPNRARIEAALKRKR